MRAKNLIVAMTLIFLVILVIASPAIAGRGCNDPSGLGAAGFISVDPKAPGTKYNGTLTIYYDVGASCAITPVPANLKDMHFFMRIEDKKDLLSFGGVGECIPYWVGAGYTAEEAVVAQQDAVEDFFKYVANPFIYSWNHPEDPDGCDPASSVPELMCPSFALKSVDKIVEDNMVTGRPLFIMMDVIFAIDD